MDCPISGTRSVAGAGGPGGLDPRKIQITVRKQAAISKVVVRDRFICGVGDFSSLANIPLFCMENISIFVLSPLKVICCIFVLEAGDRKQKISYPGDVLPW